ncbi:MAG: ferredoxin-type protein NapG [Acidobacteria bacterium]|nr:ferredoxin-type protein NapG [Acidobacteriota bacterium]
MRREGRQSVRSIEGRGTSTGRITVATRRRFLFDAARSAAGVTLVGAGLALHASQVRALPSQVIRAPGARAEPEFLAACLRCGMCVCDCPYHILELATLGQDIATGTPYFVARSRPCEMCVDIPCVKACPSGALDPELTDINQARMGLAILSDHETCLNFLGLRCEVCYRACPLSDKAITLEPQQNPRSLHAMFIPTVHSDQCTGCGKCEHACVLETAAIRVLPRRLTKGELGGHYRPDLPERIPEIAQ